METHIILYGYVARNHFYAPQIRLYRKQQSCLINFIIPKSGAEINSPAGFFYRQLQQHFSPRSPLFRTNPEDAAGCAFRPSPRRPERSPR
jgi:hypothetical protein